MTMWPPEALDAEVPDKQCRVEFHLFTSLLRFGSGCVGGYIHNETQDIRLENAGNIPGLRVRRTGRASGARRASHGPMQTTKFFRLICP
jgi:hypothetical protein